MYPITLPMWFPLTFAIISGAAGYNYLPYSYSFTTVLTVLVAISVAMGAILTKALRLNLSFIYAYGLPFSIAISAFMVGIMYRYPTVNFHVGNFYVYVVILPFVTFGLMYLILHAAREKYYREKRTR